MKIFMVFKPQDFQEKTMKKWLENPLNLFRKTIVNFTVNNTKHKLNKWAI